MYRKLFAKNDSDFSDFYENHCNYVGSHRTGDTYVREMFKGLILYYSDKFGETNFEEAYKLLYMWSYKLRLMKTRVQYNSIDKYIRENHNLFKEINSTYHPIEILKLKRKIQVLNEDCKYKIPEVMEVYKIINK